MHFIKEQMRHYKLKQYKLVCEQMCFVTLIYALILRLIIQNRFHFLLKVLLHSKFHCKKPLV